VYYVPTNVDFSTLKIGEKMIAPAKARKKSAFEMAAWSSGLISDCGD
jgi:hypothetical protein